MDQFSRTELLIGKAGLQKLAESSVIVFGLGGVGSYAVEALARAGVGHLILVDFDLICLTNLNRQLGALHSTIGRPKTEVLGERLYDINPQIKVTIKNDFVTIENIALLLTPGISYAVDAVDNVTAKLGIIQRSRELDIPVISSMGTGNRLDPSALKIADISETSGDPLARVMRRELRKRGIGRGLKVVYSTEPPIKPRELKKNCQTSCICPGGDAHCAVKRQIPGSISFVPSVSGLLLASQVVRDIIKNEARSQKDN